MCVGGGGGGGRGGGKITLDYKSGLHTYSGRSAFSLSFLLKKSSLWLEISSLYVEENCHKPSR